MYVKLFGGPLDGQLENVIDGCDKLRLHVMAPGLEPTPEPGSPCPMPVKVFHIYERSKSDPARFIYQDTEE